MKHKVVIIEDDTMISDFLENEIGSHPNYEVLKKFYNVTDAIDFIKQNNPDLLFLDLNLPDQDGFNLLKKLSFKPNVIVVSADIHRAIHGFEEGIIDFVAKPFSTERLKSALAKASRILEDVKLHKLDIKNYGAIFRGIENTVFLTFDKIVYISSHAKHSVIHTTESTIEVVGTLRDLTAKLDPSIFKRVHKQFIINLKYLSQIEYFPNSNPVAYLKDDEKSQIPISKLYFPID